MTSSLPAPHRRRRARARSTVRGAMMAEYTLLVGVVALLTMGAFIGLGVSLVVSFENRRDVLLYPFP